MKSILWRITFVCALAVSGACGSSQQYTPLLRAEPEIGATLSRPPRTLRLYFDALPDVGRSHLRLMGPHGEQRLRGLHTMAADDLMIEILDPLQNGNYTVEWTTVVGNDPNSYSGSFGFDVVGNDGA